MPKIEEFDIAASNSLFGVTFYTWGTKSTKNSGVVDFLDNLLFGGDPGHASISMRLPVNEQTREWIEQYCCTQTYEAFNLERKKPASYQEYLAEAGTKIPVTQKNSIVHTGKYDESGNVTTTAEKAYEQEYFEVEFSWWPKRLQTFAKDMIDGIKGKNFNYSEEWSDYLQPKQKKHTGRLGQRVMTYAPSLIIHQRNLPEVLFKQVYRKHQLDKIEDDLILIPKLLSKIRDLKDCVLPTTIKLMLKNLNIDIDDALNEHKNQSKTQKKDDAVNNFIDLLVKKVKAKHAELSKEHDKISEKLEEEVDVNLPQMKTELISKLESIQKKKEQLKPSSPSYREKHNSLEEKEKKIKRKLEHVTSQMESLEKFKQFYEETESNYTVAGLPPSHEIFLPFNSNGQKGFSPLAMLQKMHELTAERFDLYRLNCSVASMEVLKAGAQEDPYLSRAIYTLAFGLFGTPQQILANVEKARSYIDQPTGLITKLTNLNYLNRALGYARELVMDKKGSTLQKVGGVLLGILVALAQLPLILAKALINPGKAFNHILDTLKLIFARDSNLLKAGLLIISLPALAVLGPLSIIQTILKTTFKPFQYLYKALIAKPPRESTDIIDVPIGSQVTETVKTSNNNALAGLVNSKIYQKIEQNMVTISNLTDPKKILIEFEKLLKEQPEKVVTLSKECNEILFSDVLKSTDESYKQRFYTCCNDSLSRIQKYNPKTREDIDQIVQNVTIFEQPSVKPEVEEPILANNRSSV